MSTSIFRSTAAVAAVGVGVLSFIASPAAAQECYPPTEGCVTTTTTSQGAGLSISLSLTVVTRGQTITATMAGFQAGTSGIVTIASVEQQIGSFTMPASGGSVSTSITIPTDISLGAHTVFARGTFNGAAASASQGVTVVESTQVSGSGSSLARTGAFVIPAAVIGLGLVGTGVALKRSGRRKVSPRG